MAESEFILLRRFSTNGDAEAFTQIIKQHTPMVYGVCLRILANRDKAADVVQDTFFKLVHDASEITESLPNWLHRVATCRAIDLIRSDSQRKQRELKYVYNSQKADSEYNKAAWREISVFIDEEIDKLDDLTREFIILHFFEGQTMTGIAENFGISQPTISRRIESGIDSLRDKLKSRGIVIPAALLASMFSENIVKAAPAFVMKELGKIAIAGSKAVTAATGVKITAGISAGAAIKARIIALAAVAVIGISSLVIYYHATKQTDDNTDISNQIGGFTETSPNENVQSNIRFYAQAYARPYGSGTMGFNDFNTYISNDYSNPDYPVTDFYIDRNSITGRETDRTSNSPDISYSAMVQPSGTTTNTWDLVRQSLQEQSQPETTENNRVLQSPDAQQQTPEEITASETETLTITGHAPLQEIHCSGKVMDYETNPVARADVYMYEMHRVYEEGRNIFKQLGHTVTDSQGDYAFDIQAVDCGNIYIVAYKPGFALKYESMVNSASTHPEIFLRLGKPDVFSGRVLNQDKEPIANAKLQMLLSDPRYPITSVPSLENLFIKTTDTQGRFSFTDVPESSSAYFFVEAPGKAGTWTFWEDIINQFPAGSEDIEFVLENESRIEGRVIDEDTGQGVSGVILLAKPDKVMVQHYFPYRTVSSQEGYFELAGLVPDDYSVQVGAQYGEMPDWVGRDVKVTVGPGQTKRNVEIPVSKGSTIEITLVSQTGEPLESAQARVRQTANFGRQSCYSKTVYSDENGVATFRVPQGQCQVSAGGNLYANYAFMGDTEPTNAVKGHVHKRKIILYEKPTVSGIVTDQNGEPVANVLVTTKPLCEQSVMTDAQGRFELKFYSPLYSVQKWFLWARDFENCRASLVEITEDTRTRNITLEPAYTLSGQVTDPNGTGIPMVAVNLRTKLPGWDTFVRNKIYSDKQGRFEINSVPALLPDFELRLQTGAEGYGAASGIEIRPEGNPNIPFELTPVILQPRDQTLSGIVVDANDEPAAGIGVWLQASEMSSTVTDDQGRFFFDKVQRGPVSVQVRVGSDPASWGVTQAQGGDKNVKVILGQKLIHMSTNSLLGEPLPSMDQFNVSLDRELSQNKMILLCFADIDQRPSRNTILRLNEQAQELLDRDIYMVFIQAQPIAEQKLVAWLKNNEILPPVGMSKTGILELGSSYNWGVQSLPWLILTDTDHIVTAEGFALSELEEKIDE